MSERSSIETFSQLTEQKKEFIRTNLEEIRLRIKNSEKCSCYKQSARLLIATKTRTPDEINYAVSLGVDLIGENRVQELCEKYDQIKDSGAEIHFIGALQTNKVKYIIDKVSMIHSVDRLSLAKEIDRQAEKAGLVMNILCEVNIGLEESKSGVLPEQAEEFIRSISQFKHLKVCGLMSIPPIMRDSSIQKEYFKKIMNLYIDISTKKIDNINMSILSMGMSSDYDIAIEQGANLVRIGSALFGERTYK